MARNHSREGKESTSTFKITERGQGNIIQAGSRNVMFSGFEGTGQSGGRSPVNTPPRASGQLNFEVDIGGQGCLTQFGNDNILQLDTKAGSNTQRQQEHQHTQEELKHPVQESAQREERAFIKEEKMVHCQPADQIEETSHKHREDTSNTSNTKREIIVSEYAANVKKEKIIKGLGKNRNADESIVDSIEDTHKPSSSDEEYSNYNRLSSTTKPESLGRTLSETAGAASIPLSTPEEDTPPALATADRSVSSTSTHSTRKSGDTEIPRKVGEDAFRSLGTQVTTPQSLVFREIRGHYVLQGRQPIVDIRAYEEVLQALSENEEDHRETEVLTVAWTRLDYTFSNKTFWKISGVSKKTVLANLLKDVMQILRHLILVLFDKYKATLHEVRTAGEITLVVHHTDKQSAMKVVHSKEEVCKLLQSLVLDKAHPGHLKLDISFHDDHQSSGDPSAEMSGQLNTGQQDVRPKQINRPLHKDQGVKDQTGGNEEKQSNLLVSAPAHWVWQDDDGSWVNYEESQSAKLEAEYSSSRRSCLIKRESKRFRVDFQTMLETYVEERGKNKRTVRRIVMDVQL